MELKRDLGMESFFLIPTHRSVTEHMADQPWRAAWGAECLCKWRKKQIMPLALSLSLLSSSHFSGG